MKFLTSQVAVVVSGVVWAIAEVFDMPADIFWMLIILGWLFAGAEGITEIVDYFMEIKLKKKALAGCCH